MRTGKDEHSNAKTLITILTVICIIIILVTFSRSRLTTPVRSVTGTVVVPMSKGVSSFGNWLSSLTENLSDSQALREENELLRKQVDTLMAENSRLLLEGEELERYRKLLSLSEEYSDYSTIGARVISKGSDNWFTTFTIDKGTKDGITEGCNVIGGAGLVGIVVNSGPNWSSIRTIIDDNSNVSAMVSNTSDTCIISGDLELLDSGMLDLIKLQDEDNKVHVGDKIVTSDISEKYLPGILIGYISEIGNDPNNLTKSGKITPVVDFKHIQEVLVILDKKQYVESPDGSSSKGAVNDVSKKEG